MAEIIIIGGGLAGCEAAWQAAEFGHHVQLFEMRPGKMTEAHTTDGLSELVCSNSLGSQLITRASGLLFNELKSLDSLLVDCAEQTQLPAGGALAVDRDKFSDLVSQKIFNHPNITVTRQEVVNLPQDPVIIASGPLTSNLLSQNLKIFTGEDNLFFYDALAPIITRESINMDHAFFGSRYERGATREGDYLNCPLTCDQYELFIKELLGAKRNSLSDFETRIDKGVNAGKGEYFEGCLPIEILAGRSPMSLAYGPMRPVGLFDPATGKRPYAVLQLRQDNIAGSLYNLVGFQTNLLYSEQKRVLGVIPALEKAEFVRFGQMHRNTYISSPNLLYSTLGFKNNKTIYAAGQITGIEGYLGNIASGFVAGVNLSRVLDNQEPISFPTATMIGALCHYISNADVLHFQPMKANFGLLPFPELVSKTRKSRVDYWISQSQQAISELKQVL